MVDLTGRREIRPSMEPDVAEPLTGSPEEIAATLRAFAAEGIAHMQVYPIPNTLAGIEALAPVMELVRSEV